jgi:hypothetical protein
MRSFFCLLLSVAVSAAHAEPPQGTLEVAYELRRNGSALADVVEHLQYAGGNYQITETWKGRGFYSLLGSARRVSQGTIADKVLRPREFFDERSGRDTARAWFDWKANTLTMQYKGERKTEPLFPDAQDRLSFLLALSLLPGNGETVSYHIADGKGISHHRYQVLGQEKISTPAGEFDTVHVSRIREPNEKDTADLWLAVSLGYVPVRLVNVDKDDRFEQVATRVSRQ